MTNQTSLLENNVLRPLTDGVIFGASAALVSTVYSINPLISAVFTATFIAASEITANFLAYCLNKAGCTEDEHDYIYYPADILAIIGGGCAATTAFAVAGLTATYFPIGFILLTILVGDQLKKALHLNASGIVLTHKYA